ncbi:MAG TPA: single-stranded-DNA-specific exonuclease RecJ, partial [Thermomicrobiaceae bacterium]|nr:single-stranded-DNA-specific exonuclease RecJ [Thermomicrobiaceae bacterium]
MARYRWIEPAPIPPEGFDLHDSPLLSQILFRCGARGRRDAARFLYPQLDQLGRPEELPDLAPAIARIRLAASRGEQVAVFGDYDADGLTAATILTRALRGIGAVVQTYIPHRIVDGYGLRPAAAERIHRDGARLVVTVDCGTGDDEALAWLAARGTDAVVIDHHQVPDEHPPAVAFISPRRRDSHYPFDGLCAAGLAYQVARALLGDAGAEPLLPLAAVGTVADVVPLLDDNRVLVQQGLRRFGSPAAVGLRALAVDADVDPTAVTAWHIGYVLGPRLNAAGRVATPQPALDLLLTDDHREAVHLAAELTRYNAQRQRETERMLVDAEALLARRAATSPLMVLAGDDWSPGLAGLVASRLVEHHHRPAVVLARGEETSRGSARSIAGFDIAAALQACGDLLVEHGGHRGAAGLTVETANLAELEARLGMLLERTFAGGIPEPALELDAELHPNELTLTTTALVSALEPTGAGNPAPVFFTRGLHVTDARPSRDGKHLMFDAVARDGRATHAVAFQQGGRLGELDRLERVD